ncbi:MAG: hypothetical protein ACMUIG_03735 [Thermoplasmatota archaeon]
MRTKKNLIELMFSLMLLIIVAGAVFPMIPSDTQTEVAAQEGGAPMILTEGRMYLKESMSMDPVPPDVNDEYQTVSIPNGFIRDGFFGYGLLPIGHTYWRDVAIWTTQPMRHRINLGGTVEITVFAAKEGNSVTIDFEFQILRQDEAEPMIRLSASNEYIQGGADATLIRVIGAFPPGNDTTVEADTQLVFKVRARANIQEGSASLRFGSSKTPSGFTFGSNSLQAHALYMSEEAITFEYKDAFMIPWVQMHTSIYLDGTQQTQNQLTSQMNIENQTRMIIYPLESDSGEYTLFASIAYDPTGFGNVSMQSFSKLEDPKFNLGATVKNFISRSIQWLLLIALIFGAIFGFAYYRGKVWNRRFLAMPADTQTLSKSKKKKLWKDDRKKSKLDRKARRKAQKIKHQEALAKGEEHRYLFKKKQVVQEPKINASDLKDLDLDL